MKLPCHLLSVVNIESHYPNLQKVLNMNITQKICLTCFLVLCAAATYATSNGVPKCDTIFGQHLDRSQGQCI